MKRKNVIPVENAINAGNAKTYKKLERHGEKGPQFEMKLGESAHVIVQYFRIWKYLSPKYSSWLS